MYTYNIDSFLGTASVLIIFFVFVFVAIALTLYVFSSLGVMCLAKKNNLDNTWMAFIPVARSYLIAKMGYELYVPSSKKNSTLTWVTLGVAAASFLFGDKDSAYVLNLALLVLESIAFYNIFKALKKNEVLYTVFTVLTGGTLGGIFLYASHNDIKETPFKEEKKENDVLEALVEKEVKEDSEPKKETRQKFCSTCGNKLNKTSKYCGNCGQKIE